MDNLLRGPQLQLYKPTSPDAREALPKINPLKKTHTSFSTYNLNQDAKEKDINVLTCQCSRLYTEPPELIKVWKPQTKAGIREKFKVIDWRKFPSKPSIPLGLKNYITKHSDSTSNDLTKDIGNFSSTKDHGPSLSLTNTDLKTHKKRSPSISGKYSKIQQEMAQSSRPCEVTLNADLAEERSLSNDVNISKGNPEPIDAKKSIFHTMNTRLAKSPILTTRPDIELASLKTPKLQQLPSLDNGNPEKNSINNLPQPLGHLEVNGFGTGTRRQLKTRGTESTNSYMLGLVKIKAKGLQAQEEEPIDSDAPYLNVRSLNKGLSKLKIESFENNIDKNSLKAIESLVSPILLPKSKLKGTTMKSPRSIKTKASKERNPNNPLKLAGKPEEKLETKEIYGRPLNEPLEPETLMIKPEAHVIDKDFKGQRLHSFQALESLEVEKPKTLRARILQSIDQTINRISESENIELKSPPKRLEPKPQPSLQLSSQPLSQPLKPFSQPLQTFSFPVAKDLDDSYAFIPSPNKPELIKNVEQEQSSHILNEEVSPLKKLKKKLRHKLEKLTSYTNNDEPKSLLERKLVNQSGKVDTVEGWTLDTSEEQISSNSPSELEYNGETEENQEIMENREEEEVFQ